LACGNLALKMKANHSSPSVLCSNSETHWNKWKYLRKHWIVQYCSRWKKYTSRCEL